MEVFTLMYTSSNVPHAPICSGIYLNQSLVHTWHAHTYAHTNHPSICCWAPRTPLGRGDAGHSGWFYVEPVWMDRNTGGCEASPDGMSGGSTDTGSFICMVKWRCHWWFVKPAWIRAWKEQPGWLQCRALSVTTRYCCRHCFFSSLHDVSWSSACLFRSSTLRLMVALQESCSCACFLQLLDRLHCFRSFITR